MTGEPSVLAHWTAVILNIGSSNENLYLWSGEGDIEIGGKTYRGLTINGTQLSAISSMESVAGLPDRQLRIEVLAPEAIWRDLFDYDWGPLTTTVGFVLSQDGGHTWTPLNRSFTGFLSNPELNDGIFSFEVVSAISDTDQSPLQNWSEERDPIFANMRELENGFEIGWPP